ncbi:hypothetical protein, partial [Aeromonas enteropelogenes]|uniref:hypothetical protein n=1 Tax=Aeromonas enteropelogenes TaxID=29489 RepID=UPI003B9E0353
SCMETRLDHRRSACSNFINKVRSRPGLERSDHKLLIRVPGTVQHSVNQNLKIQISAEKCHLFNNKGIAFKRCLSMTQPITPGASMS